MKRAAIAIAAVLLGCHSKSSGPSAGPQPDAGSLVADRPYELDLPSPYDPAKAAPLLLALHGYGDRGGSLGSARWGLSRIAASHGVIVVHPEGTLDSAGHRFWSATDSCCDFEGKRVDDVKYLTAVVDDVAARYRVDPKRVWIAGLSNGGFMAHRLACDHAERFAAIVSIAGSTWNDSTRCAQSGPVSVLEVHGAEDALVRYEGGASLLQGKGGAYPSAEATVSMSAAKAGCTGSLAPAGARTGLDADRGKVTEVARWSGCPGGIDVELWKMMGAGHIPMVTDAWSEAVIGWLEKHPKP